MGDIAAFRKLPNYIQSMFRNEAVPFQVEAAPGGGWELQIKLQLLPGRGARGGARRAGAAVDDLRPDRDGRRAARAPAAAARSTSRSTRRSWRLSSDAYPEAPAGPWFLPWTATDSRFFRSPGVPSYGFSPFLIMNTDTLQVDNANERFALPGFVEGVAHVPRSRAPPDPLTTYNAATAVAKIVAAEVEPLRNKGLRSRAWHGACFEGLRQNDLGIPGGRDQ